MLDVATAETQVPVDGDATRPGPPRWLAAALAIVAAALLVLWFIVSRSDDPHDPRAYPGSQSQDLPGTLSRYQLRLPDCAAAAARFHRYAQWEADHFHLRLSADRHCVNTFLALNGLFLTDADVRPGLPFDAATTVAFGWPQDPAAEYLTVARAVRAGAALVDVEVAVHQTGEHTDLYLHAGIV